MEKNEIYKPGIFKGAGILTGFIIGAVAGVIFVIITGVMGLVGAISGAVALPTGLYLEKKFQKKQSEHYNKVRKIYLLLLILGSILFFCLFIIAKIA